MSEALTRGVRVRVSASYVPERSAPEDGYYFFAYRVQIANEGQQAVQLVSRRWVISGPEGEVGRVEGPGVVGRQPLLSPGESFEYTSFCPLKTAFGAMHGSYRMLLPSGEAFEAEIAPFALAAPNALN